MQTTTYDKKGKKTLKKVTLDKVLFEADINKDLITQAVYVYLSNQRQSNAHTKNRGEVRGGGAKPWKQKGTGRARHGSSRSPIWTGGEVTFGPRNTINYKKAFPKKMRKAAIRAALSQHASEGRIYIFEGVDLGTEKLTQTLIKILETAKLEGKTLIIQNEVDSNLIKAGSNIKGTDITVVNEVNTYMLLKYKNVIILQDALKTMSDFWSIELSDVDSEESKVVEEKVAVKQTKKSTESKK